MTGWHQLNRRLLALLGSALVGLSLLAGAGSIGLTAMATAARAASSGASFVCGSDDVGTIPWPEQPRPGTGATLVPRGADSLTICSYNGLNATVATPQFGLNGVGRVDGSTPVGRLAGELDAIGPTPPGAVTNCPMDDGSQQWLVFDYSSGPGVVVTVGANGCREISNRQIRRMGLDAPVIGQLTKLVRPVALKWSTVIGHIQLCGGPAPSRCHIGGFRGVDQVNAVNASDRTVAFAAVHDGHFRFRVAAPGSYRFELTGSGKRPEAIIPKVRATLIVGQTTTVVIPISLF